MKKTIFILAAGIMAFASCNHEPSFKISGKAEGIADSTWVYLQEAHGMRLAKVDSAMILNEAFTLKGRQDSTVLRYLTAKTEGSARHRINFFLENGNISVNLCGEASATGTPSNDAYQAFRNELNEAKRPWTKSMPNSAMLPSPTSREPNSSNRQEC